MPALPPVPGVIKVHHHASLQDDTDVILNWHLGYTGAPPSTADVQAIATSAHTAWGNHLSPLQNSNYVLEDTTTIDLSSASGHTGFLATSVPGTRAGATLTASVAAIINKEIGRRYRGGKPKNFLWAGVETDIFTVGTWKAAFVASVNTGWLAFTNEVLATAGLAIVLTSEVNVSYYSGFTSVQNPVTHRWRNIPTVRVSPVVDGVLGVTTATKIGSQRRRNQ